MISYYKIIHVICHTQWGGLEKRIFNESLWMEKNGHKIIIVTPKDTPLFLKAKAHGLKVYAVEFKRLSMIKDYNSLKTIFKNEKPDIITTHGDRDSTLALYAANKAKVPLRILSRHGSAPVKMSWYSRLIYQKLCHYMFTTTDHTAKELQKAFKFNNMPIFSMPTGIIEPDHLLEKNEARRSLASELGLDPGTKFIGFVGRVSKDRDIPTLFKAFKRNRPGLPAHHLALVGEGTDEYVNFLKQLAMNLKINEYIHFIGFKENVWPCYRAFDCNVLPHTEINGRPWEDVSQTILEAMICDCPVVVSKNCGIFDIIDHGKTGVLFNPGDPVDLADKIMQTLQSEDATKKQIKAARDHVIKYHTLDIASRNIIRIYRLHQFKMEKQHLH